MLSEAQDTLLTLAEVAIALAGFSAIVLVFRRNADGKWRHRDADQFHGMVIHAICTVLFCLLPALVNLVVQDAVLTLRICCALLGVQMVAHAVGVMRFATSDWLARVLLLFGLLLGLTQFAVFTAWGIHREFEIYVAGIMWHILQAGVLFVLLIWIDKEDIERTNEGGR